MDGKAGGIIGLSLALVLVLALAGTPFYLGMLRGPERALDAAVSDDAEVVRRAIANLDHELALIAYMYAGADPKGLDPATVGPIGRSQPDLFEGPALRDLEKASGALTSVSQRDTQRGTVIADRGASLRGPANAEAVVQQAATQLKTPEQILRRAESAMNALRAASAGGLSAANHLDANRVRAIFLLTKARMEMDKATFERSQAALLWAAAEKQTSAIEHLRSRLEALALQDPKLRVENVAAGLERAKAGSAQLQQAIGQLSALIQSREQELAQLVSAAAAAKEQLQALDPSRMSFEAYRSRYEELSRSAREAESKAAALVHGTLRGAREVAQDGPEPTVPQYEDGMIDPGLETLRFRLEQFQEQAETLRSMQEGATRELAALDELAGRLKDEAASLSKQIQSESANLRDLLEQASKLVATADKSTDDSVKLLKDASNAARSAITAAKKRASDAGAAARSGEKVDERLQRISQDAETEAYVHTIAGQIAYNTALARYEQLQAARSQKEILAIVRRVGSGEGTGASVDVDALQTEAVNYLSEAVKSFEQAATLIGRINVRFPDNTTASGKNYVWQAQLGQAACHLLHAALIAVDREASFQQQMLAYNLLKEAVEKREQSPLLASAVDTLLYLQQNAR